MQINTSNHNAKNQPHSRPSQPAHNRPPLPPLDLVSLLPAELREKISRSLKNGEAPASLASRLNTSLEIRQFMALNFASQRLTEEHLAAWRQSGHLDWLQSVAIDEKARQLATEAAACPIEHALRNLALRYAAAITLLDERGCDPALEKRVAFLERAMKNLLAVTRQPQQEGRLDLQKKKLEFEIEKFRQSNAPTANEATTPGKCAAEVVSRPTSIANIDPANATPAAPPPESSALPILAPLDEPAPDSAPETVAEEAAVERQPAVAAPIEPPTHATQPVRTIVDSPYRFGMRY